MFSQKLPTTCLSSIPASSLSNLSWTRRAFSTSPICNASVASSSCILGFYPHHSGRDPQSHGEYVKALGRGSQKVCGEEGEGDCFPEVQGLDRCRR